MEWIEFRLSTLAPWLLSEYNGHALWVWAALPLGFTVAYLAAALAVRISAIALNWAISRRHERFYQRYIAPLLASLQLWLSAVLFAAIIQLLPLSEAWRKNLGYFIGTTVTFAIVWALFRLITNAGESLREYFVAHHKIAAAAIIPMMRKLIKTLLAAMALLFLLQNWGFDIMALLAGLGIGGIALALASQKSVENLFGGVSVTLDQPVRVGDFINFGNNVGTVEDIGLRSTSIRTPQRTRVTIPNSQFSELQLENFAARDKILLKKTIGLRYDTSPDCMRGILRRIMDLLESHDKVEKGGRARFIDFGASSLDIEIYAYICTADFKEFLIIQEQLLLAFMDIVKEAGSDFAFPSTSLYLENAAPLPPAPSPILPA